MKAKLFFLCTLVIPCFSYVQASWAERMLDRLTLEQKVGQLFMVGVAFEIPEEHAGKEYMLGHYVDQEKIDELVSSYHIGGVIFFSMELGEQLSMANRLQRMSEIPLLTGLDAEWGIGFRLHGGMVFPKNMTLGAITDDRDRLLYDYGYELGCQCRAIGVHVAFAPDVDINTNPYNPIIGMRSFGSSPESVAHNGTLVARGMQAAGVLACAKHFPGHGDTDVDSHLALPRIIHSLEHLQKQELSPFKALIDAGVACVMSAHLSVPALDDTLVPGSEEITVPATLSRKIITGLVREDLGFDGLIFTDAMSMGGITKLYGQQEAALLAIEAGSDIVLVPVEVEKTIPYVVSAVRSGRLSLADLDRHVLRILQAKEKVGLHERKLIDIDTAREVVHSQKALALKKRLYQRAVTVVLDDERVVPLDEDQRSSVLIVDIRDRTEEEFSRIVDALQAADTVVVRIFRLSNERGFGKVSRVDDGVRKILAQLKASQKNVIIILCMSPYALPFLPDIPTIIAYESDDDAVEAAMKVFWGEVRATGTLPIIGQ